MILDTTSKTFLEDLEKHLKDRGAALLKSIYRQFTEMKSEQKKSLEDFEARALNEDVFSILRRLDFLDGVEKSVEKAGFLDRKEMG